MAGRLRPSLRNCCAIFMYTCASCAASACCSVLTATLAAQFALMSGTEPTIVTGSPVAAAASTRRIFTLCGITKKHVYWEKCTDNSTTSMTSVPWMATSSVSRRLMVRSSSNTALRFLPCSCSGWSFSVRLFFCFSQAKAPILQIQQGLD